MNFSIEFFFYFKLTFLNSFFHPITPQPHILPVSTDNKLFEIENSLSNIPTPWYLNNNNLAVDFPSILLPMSLKR